jgi:hypothetical protein
MPDATGQNPRQSEPVTVEFKRVIETGQVWIDEDGSAWTVTALRAEGIEVERTLTEIVDARRMAMWWQPPLGGPSIANEVKASVR